MPNKSLARQAKDALDVQDACNLSGVARGFVRAIDELRKTYPSNEDYHRHPIIKLWADKLASLTDTQGDWDYSVAHEACCQMVETEKPIEKAVA